MGLNLITSIHSSHYGTKLNNIHSFIPYQYFKGDTLWKKGNALFKSAAFCLIIESRKLRVSISKILLNWQKKTGVYACVQCANSTQLPLQKFLKVIVCFNKVFQKSKYIFSSNSFLKMNFKPPEINILVTFRGFPLYCHLSKAHLISAFHPPPPHTSSHFQLNSFED